MDSWERIKGEIREAVKDWPPLVRSGVHLVTEYPLLILAASVGLLYWRLSDDDFWATMRFFVEIIIAVVALGFFYWRLRNQDKQVAHQIRKETDDRFTTAVKLLGSTEASARAGAIYSLYQLFVDDKENKYRAQIAQILCSHIRTKTQEPEYQKNHKDRPSSEIQTTIDLLFREEKSDMGIYCRKEIVEQKGFPTANLRGAYLRRANFWGAHCERADFNEVHCERARFEEAYCKWTGFQAAHCEGANFLSANCESIDFEDAHCEGAIFYGAYCEGAIFYSAHCEGADFELAHCEKADFQNASFEATNFLHVNAEDANFQDANFKGSFASSDISEYYSSGAERIKGQIGKDTRLESMSSEDDEGMITGVLEDSDKLQRIIQKLKELEKVAFRPL